MFEYTGDIAKHCVWYDDCVWCNDCIKFRTVGWDVLDLVPVKEERQIDAVVHQGNVMPRVSSHLENKKIIQ